MPLSSDCIQDKEKSIGFYQMEPECGCTQHHDAVCLANARRKCWPDDDWMKNCHPIRCRNCDKELKRWQREMNGIEQIKKQFKWSRHKFIKFATLGLPGTKEFPIDLAEDQVKLYRENLVAKFKLLRRTKVWKNSVDGGKWYFEITSRTSLEQMHIECEDNSIINVKLNPHLHILFMGPAKMDYDKLQKECKRLGLGKFHFSPIKKGSKFKNAIKYISSYLKKDNQFQGVNRGSFGFLQGKKK